MTGRWTIYAREDSAEAGSQYYEVDADGWMNRYVSLRADWSPLAAWGTAELKPSSDRWFGRIAHDYVDDWLRKPNVELVTAGRFEEIWGLARGALGLPVELFPFAGK